MTSKLTITDERLAELVAFKPLPSTDINSATRDEWMAMAAELQERRKADSEPVELPLDYLQGHKDGLEWAAQLAKANHPETGDWLYDDPIELAKAISKGPDMPPSQPAMDSEPVAWENGCDKAVPAALRYLAENPRPIGGESSFNTAHLYQLAREIESMSKVSFYRHAQQPVVDADDNFYSWFGREWAENYQYNQYTTAAKQMLGVMAESAWIAATERQRQKQSVSVPDVKIYEDVPYGVGRFKTHRDCYCDGWNACRAAMLNHPSSIQPNTDAATGTEIKHPSSNSPVIPEGYVMVPKEPTPEMLEVINEAIKSMRGSAATYARVLAAAPQEVK